MRLVAAIAVLAVALPAALYLHGRHVWRTETHTLKGDNAGFMLVGRPGVYHDRVLTHPSWEDPVALVIALGALGVAVTAGRRSVRPSRP